MFHLSVRFNTEISVELEVGRTLRDPSDNFTSKSKSPRSTPQT